MNKKQEIIRGHLTCTCDEAYKSRNMADPNCFLCEYESEIELMMQKYAEQQLKNCNLQNVNNRFNWNHFFIGYGIGLLIAFIIWLTAI